MLAMGANMIMVWCVHIQVDGTEQRGVEVTMRSVLRVVGWECIGVGTDCNIYCNLLSYVRLRKLRIP